MSDELKLKSCPFCGGEAVLNHGHMITATGQYLANVKCSECGIASRVVWSTDSPEEAVKEAIEAWNRRVATDMNVGDKERTAKVSEHDASITDTDGYKYQRSEYLCGNCKKKVLSGDEYCSHCGCRLDWGEDIPMEYFESGGI